eukprot:6986-Heterococcus_DN1.PRE.1
MYTAARYYCEHVSCADASVVMLLYGEFWPCMISTTLRCATQWRSSSALQQALWCCINLYCQAAAAFSILCHNAAHASCAASNTDAMMSSVRLHS